MRSVSSLESSLCIEFTVYGVFSFDVMAVMAAMLVGNITSTHINQSEYAFLLF